MVSPAGMEEIFRQGYHYFKRTIDDVRLYKERIEQLVSEAVATGYKTITLVGKSDLDFLVEYACGKQGVVFKRVNDDKDLTKDSFSIFSEQYDSVNKELKKHWLRTIVTKGESNR